MNLPLPPEQIERAARIYRTSKEAAAAIGCSSVHFQRLCKRYGVLTPIQRRKQNAAPPLAHRASDAPSGVGRPAANVCSGCGSIMALTKPTKRHRPTLTPLARPTRQNKTISLAVNLITE
ncbi:MAG: hypothetical protein ACJ0UT_07875 [Candidatus Latescibacterota bacterium]